MNKLLVILGPTATGKTDLALKFASKFEGELVSCDSRQVYRGLDIGTGKYHSGKCKVQRGKSFWQINSTKVWMYDVVSPRKQYSVANYVKDANNVIDSIWRRRKLPVVVGGTGLYLKALLEGLPNLEIPVDKKLRRDLAKLSPLELQEKLKALSPMKFKKLNDSDKQNPRRLVRAIELSLSSSRLSRHFVPRNDVFRIGLTASREVLYKNVDRRVLTRIDQGMIEEAETLHKNGLTLNRMKQLGLEYGVLADYLEGKIKSEEEFIKVLQGKIHGYVRRQLTWFKKMDNINWFDKTHKNYVNEVEKLVASWYHGLRDETN